MPCMRIIFDEEHRSDMALTILQIPEISDQIRAAADALDEPAF